MTVSWGDMRRNLTILMDNEVWRVLEYSHRKAPHAAPTMTLKLKSLKTGKVLEKTFNANVKLAAAPTELRPCQFLYRDGEDFVFMDTQTFEQFSVAADAAGDTGYYLVEGGNCDVRMFQGAPVVIELPTTVVLEVTDTEPSFKGDTQAGNTKPAVTGTGLKLQVPFFVNAGQKIKVDTRTGEYVERAE
jgi:elongation factor P